MQTVVVNVRHERYDRYIGRPGPFGNPFAVGRDGTPQQCLDRFRDYFLKRVQDDREFRRQVLLLRGKRLGCFCKSRPPGREGLCHGDVIAEWVDEQFED